MLSFAAKGLTVNVNDLNLDSLATLKAGRLPFIEYGAEDLLTNALRDNKLIFTSTPGEISNSGPVIVTIGTPVDEFLNPERHVVLECIDSLLPHMSDGQLLVLRSTLYPGTTDWVSAHLKRKRRNLNVAFCPERIVQGYGVEELARCRRSSAARQPEAAEEAAALFRMIIAPRSSRSIRLRQNSPKLFGNAYRYIEFAMTNQFYLIAQSAGLDYQRILKAMKYNYPSCPEYSRARICRRAVPDEGHHAADRLRSQRIHASVMRRCWSMKVCRSMSLAISAAATISKK